MTYVVETLDAPGEWKPVRTVSARHAAESILSKVPVADLPARIRGVPDGEVLVERAAPVPVEVVPDPLQHIVDRANHIAEERALMEEDIYDAARGLNGGMKHSNRALAAAAGISPPSIPGVIERVAIRRAAKKG